MLVFPNAKINLGLQILKKRPDGYHEIATVLYPIGWKDALEFVPSQHTSLQVYGTQEQIPMESNLVYKAYKLLKQDFDLPPLEIHLKKCIPSGAGLGGGSADAAFMLISLNEYFELNISIQKLESYAASLGSDCPIFIQNKPMIATGRGEHLEPIYFSLPWKHLTVVKPKVSIASAEAYQGVTPNEKVEDLKTIISRPETWNERLINDFEKSVFQKYPELLKIKKQLYDLGASYASLSGSGSAHYAFSINALRCNKFKEEGFEVWQGQIL